jgi:hypothetical protein
MLLDRFSDGNEKDGSRDVVAGPWRWGAVYTRATSTKGDNA